MATLKSGDDDRPGSTSCQTETPDDKYLKYAPGPHNDQVFQIGLLLKYKEIQMVIQIADGRINR
jgi:hypothetical protein